MRRVRDKSIWLALAALACTSNPRSVGAYDWGTSPRSDCPHRVELLWTTELTRPYRELARLSATCPKLSPRVCEQTLLERGCELDADAVVIDASTMLAPDAHPPSDSHQRGTRALLSQEARAIRYAVAGQAP